MCLQFGFVIFWQNDFGAKAANKMLVKLTPGVQQIRQEPTRVEHLPFLSLRFSNHEKYL
jgi:hypothetical protein